MSEPLDRLVDELEQVAGRLKGGELGPGEAAELVERCADLATSVAAELDVVSRTASETEGQERLL